MEDRNETRTLNGYTFTQTARYAQVDDWLKFIIKLMHARMLINENERDEIEKAMTEHITLTNLNTFFNRIIEGDFR